MSSSRRLSAYALKRWLVAPRTAFRRWGKRGLSEVDRSMLEAQYYQPAMYQFIGATLMKPDLLFDADLDENSVVVDAGAYRGEWAQQIGRRYGCRIYAVEPGPQAVRAAADALADFKATLVPVALGAADGKATLALGGPGSSLYDAAGTFGSVDVDVRDVAALFQELGIESIDLLKINIEGGEYDVFDRLFATGWLPRTRQVSVQFHEWHPGAYRRRREIRRRLRETHEELWCYPWVWEFWRRRDDLPATRA